MVDRVHVAIAPWKLSYDYNRHAGVVLVSLLEHCSFPVTIYILYDENLSSENEELSEFNRCCYKKISEKYGCNIIFVHADFSQKQTKNIKDVSRLTPGTLMRLFLPELLPNTDKVIYLDCDLIVHTNIDDLWNLQLGKYAIAAYMDETLVINWPEDQKRLRSDVGIPMDVYFNSGVMVMNLQYLREDKFTEKTYDFLMKHPNIIAPDEAAINWYCQGKYLHIDKRYNRLVRCIPYDERIRLLNDVDCIIHYCTLKPWEEYIDEFDDYYWDYLRKTPWCENIHIWYNYLHTVPNVSKSIPLLEKDFFKYLGNRTRGKKIQFVLHFIACIVKSCLNGLFIIIKSTMRHSV